MVGTPERLVFEGGPIVEPPLRQDLAARRPLVVDGTVLDATAACQPLTAAEQKKLAKLKAKETGALQPEADRTRKEYVDAKIPDLIRRTGMSEAEARATLDKQINAVLLSSIELPFDDPALTGKTVGDVLSDPKRYEKETLADPIEGVAYGRNCAVVLIGRDTGVPFIYSHAHGGITYTLQLAEAELGNTIARLNRVHAVLPIGGKTRVVTFGELDDFPGRETIVMTQTIDDFRSLNNKYRHVFRDEKGELKKIPLGNYWVGSEKRRQYDGGMAFMPNHDGDVGNRLNLWRGFGVKAIKGDCQKFLNFMLDVICSGNAEHFNYLIKREATILQKRIRSEIAISLWTKEEGCGKGFYEAVFRRLLGNHAMLITKPDHIIGKFNPHLETLLRLTADEALFVHNPDHRNTLFTLITEGELTIEPKGCGVYPARNFLNISTLSNADHHTPISSTARRFFIPTVSAARRQDFKYFGELKAELDGGGYEALLYHLLHEIDLKDFNVRDVPRTAGLDQQAAYSRRGVDLLVEIACHEAVAPCQNGARAGVSICPDTNDSYGRVYQGLDNYIARSTDRELKNLSALTVKLRLAKEWKCITGDAARLRIDGVQRSCVIWPALSDLRARFESRHGKQDWTHTVTDWLSANPRDEERM
jgi:hypothetical protein